MQNPRQKPDFDAIPELEAMRAGIDYKFKVTCRNFSVLLRPLTMNEHMHIVQETADVLSRLSEVERHRLSENTIFARKVLMLASTSDIDKMDFKIHIPMLDKMTDREIHFLYKEWVAGCDRVDPSLDVLPPAKVKELVERLKKSPSEAIELSFLELASVCQSLIKDASPEAK